MAQRIQRRTFLAGLGGVVGVSGFGCARAVPTESDPQTLSDWLRASTVARETGVRRCLERIRTMDASIQAWVQVLPQTMTATGALSGIPFGVKDVFETRGLATEYGSPIYKGRIGTVDAAMVRDLRNRGGILLGKTHTAAFAFRDPPPTHNPRNLNNTPGGSSSGSAAAVAAGMVPLAIGTQTTGSTVRPASYCGVTGFKPTFGLFPTEGILRYAPSLDTVGFFTHTAEDMLLLWQALGRSVGQQTDFTVGVPDPFPNVEPVMVKACEQAVAQLRGSGVPTRRIDVWKTLVDLDSAQHVVSYYEGAREHRKRFEQYGDRLGQLADLVREGLQISDSAYAMTKRFIADTRARFTQMYRDTQIILVPAATGPAPVGLSSTGDRRMNSPWSALGTPAISIPMPVGDRLPLGLQLTAALGEDAALLQAAVRIAKLL
jgi:Asp-tRNA(Asn)/Glu-tRNA(Gln) amidotransferase A subunit family amidase